MNSFLDAQLAILVTSDPTLKTALLSSTNLNLSGKQKTLLESSISAANAGPEKALLLYSCGKYEASLKELHGVSGESACWGRLSSHILLKDWSAAHVDLFQLEEHFKHITDQKELLNKRGWWINWSLFVLCRDSKVDLVLDVYQCWINVIQTTCPWVMRYLAIFKLVKKKALTLPQFKETAQMLAMEERLYQDAFTRLASLSESLDFERASKDLIAADALFESDYFLASNPALRQSFMEAARLYVFELYSRIHQSVSLRLIKGFIYCFILYFGTG